MSEKPISVRSLKKKICNDDLRRANERVTELFELGLFSDDDLDGLIDAEAVCVAALNGFCDQAVASLAS